MATYPLPTSPLTQLLCFRGLSISTNILVHPEFYETPRAYARGQGVNLVDDVFPETDFLKGKEDPYGDEKIEKARTNIHVVRHGAIRLLTQRDDEGDWLRSINLNPSVLLYEHERHLLAMGDLERALDILRAQVAPLLAEPRDDCHIVPGDGGKEGREPIAYWSTVDSEFLFPDIQVPCLHDLSHPSTGPAEGGKRDRIQLGDRRDPCMMRIKPGKWQVDAPGGPGTIRGIRVRLALKDQKLTAEFGRFGTTALIRDTKHLVDFPQSSVAHIHQSMMSHLQGTYLPVPPEWTDKEEGKRNRHAKVMALVSVLTSIPTDELRAMDEEIRSPSDSTRKRLKGDIATEVARLNPVPVSTLFTPAAYGLT